MRRQAQHITNPGSKEPGVLLENISAGHHAPPCLCNAPFQLLILRFPAQNYLGGAYSFIFFQNKSPAMPLSGHS